jgi:hypothetical protein
MSVYPAKTGGVWYVHGEGNHQPGRAERITRYEQTKDTTEWTIAPADRDVFETVSV